MKEPATYISIFSLIISLFIALLQYRDRRFKIAIPIFLRSYGTNMSPALKNDSKFAININNFSARSAGIYKICFIGSDSKEYIVKNEYFEDFGQHHSDSFNGYIDDKKISFTKKYSEAILKTELPVFNLAPYESMFRFFEINTIPKEVEIIKVKLFSTRKKKPIILKVDQQLIKQEQWQKVRY